MWAEGMDGGSVGRAIEPRTAGREPRGPPTDPPRGGKAAPPPGPLAGCQGVLNPVSVDPDSDGVLKVNNSSALFVEALIAAVGTDSPPPPPACAERSG